MPSTLDIRRRIRSVKNTQQITKAMKMVSAAKLRRAQERMIAARPYATALRQVLASVGSRVESIDHPLLRRRDEHRVLVIVVTGDKGLAGAFSANIIKNTQWAIRDNNWTEVSLLPIGRKGADFFKRRTWPIRHSLSGIFQALDASVARSIAELVIDDYVNERVDAVYIAYNEFKSMIAQTIRVEKILPLATPEKAANAEQTDYLFEPAPEEILAQLLPRYVEFQIHRALLESNAAEHAARMAAMEAATKNASDMIDSLTLTYNRIRQAAITKEIIEIVSGAQALG